MKTTLTAVSALLFGMSPLSAALILPGTLDIDFRDGTWSGASGNQSFTVGGSEANGNFFLDFGANRNVAKIDFKSAGISDYSVAGFSVPEGGSTLAILGMAMASLTFWQRRSAK